MHDPASAEEADAADAALDAGAMGFLYKNISAGDLATRQELPGDDDGSRTLELTTACMDATTGPVESIYLGMPRG